jgi:tRNA(fMet)-specific endonuclease VapC
MPRFMLDADTVSYALRGVGQVGAQLLKHRPSELCLSSITLAELEYCVEAKRSERLRRAVRVFVADVSVVPFDAAAAHRFSAVAAALARRGEPIGTFDTLVASHALSLDLTVVTNNTRHFRRVPGLRVESWA